MKLVSDKYECKTTSTIEGVESIIAWEPAKVIYDNGVYSFMVMFWTQWHLIETYDSLSEVRYYMESTPDIRSTSLPLEPRKDLKVFKL